jgi:gluconate 2-dehydrogenase gamma chain
MFDVDQIDRRAMLQQVALLLGVSAIPTEAFAASKKSGARKRFLTPAQFAVLNAVADTIIPVTDTPGAVGAGVPAKLDGMLSSWASAATRTTITDGLGRIDTAAKTATGKGFAALTAAERATVLKPHDAAALKPVAPPPGAPKGSPFAPTVYVADNGYYKIKGLVIALYYASEIAMTQELIYEHVPGAWQPSIKTTSSTRPWASVGPF